MPTVQRDELRRNRSIILFVALVAVAALAGGAALLGTDSRSDDQVETGVALQEPLRRQAVFQRFLRPGTSFINMDAPLMNRSDDEVTIIRVDPLWQDGKDSVASVSEIRVGPRSERSELPWGNYYASDPPSEVIDGECATQELFPAAGYVLRPNKQAAVAATIKVLDTGVFRISDFRITYKVGDDVLTQTIPSGVGGRSRPQPPPVELGEDEGCAS